MALQFLASGADGILFDVCNAPGFAPHELLKGIKWPYCVLSFLLDDKQDATLLLQQYISKDIDPASVRGALFWETIPKKSSLNYFLNQCAHVKSLGFNVPVASPVEEISEALFAGARLYEHHARSHNEHVVINAIAFCLGAESSFFEIIAKVRTLRALWRQVAVAYGHADFHPMQLHLHVRSLPVTDDSFGPHENMLKGTYSAIAAVMGGCDALTIMAESPRPFVQRWAKNVSPILREECFVDQANDAIAGSYALEAMTYEISRAAWSRFQQKWNGA